MQGLYETNRNSPLEALARQFVNLLQSSLGQIPDREIRSALSLHDEPFIQHDLRLHRGNYTRDDLVLNNEDVGQLAIVFLGPQIFACFSFDEIGRYPDPVAAAPHSALDNVAHAQLAPDLSQVGRASSVSEA